MPFNYIFIKNMIIFYNETEFTYFNGFLTYKYIRANEFKAARIRNDFFATKYYCNARNNISLQDN